LGLLAAGGKTLDVVTEGNAVTTGQLCALGDSVRKLTLLG